MTRSDGHWPALPTARGVSPRARAARRTGLLVAVVAAVGVVAAANNGAGWFGGDDATGEGARAAATAGSAARSAPASSPGDPASGGSAGASGGGTGAGAGTGTSGGSTAGASGQQPGESSLAAADTRPVTLAFAGDVHYEGSSASAVGGNLGTAARVLAKADLAVVNLETAITERGNPEPKTYTFRAPARAVAGLRRAGVDAVSIANNHGMDFGRVGLLDTLDAAEKARMPLLGGGEDAERAWQPLRVTKRGVRISVIAATDVLDWLSWVAGPRRPGLASAKDTSTILAAVRAEARRADVVVVFLHWGVERVVCPTERQRDLARQLSAAGADVVVGSHAHVVQPAGKVGRTVVKYGMGNFVFYTASGPGTRTGVFTVTVDRSGVRSSAWVPATIRGGRPKLLDPDAARQRLAADARQARSCG